MRKSTRKSLRYRGTTCLNCGHSLDRSDRFCPYCSQENSNKQLSASDYFKEFIGSILVYDSRLRYTLREILFKPGLISKNYIGGQRMKYANPFRFFLSVSIIYFLLKGILIPGNIPEKTSFEYDTEYTVFAPMPIGIDSAAIKRSETNTTTHVKEEKLKILDVYSETALDSLSFFEEKLKRGELYFQYHRKYPLESPEEALIYLNHELSVKNKWFYNRVMALTRISKNQKSFVDAVTSNMPFFLFFFAPIFALFLWLIYSKRYNYMEHLVFLFFVFSFYFLAKIPLLFVEYIFSTDTVDYLFIFLFIPIYFFLALRKFYEQSFWKTFLKFIFLGFIFSIGYIVSIIFYILLIAAVF